MNYNIAVITPSSRDDYLVNTILDGFFSIHQEHPEFDFHFFNTYPHPFGKVFTNKFGLKRDDFMAFARDADLVLLTHGKYGTDFEVADELNVWQKTVYIDGGELGKDRRYDPVIQKQLEEGTYTGEGAIDEGMLKSCVLYFRREKPYRDGIIPLPFAIQSRYSAYFDPSNKKVIDFVCIFGQDEHPLLRRQVTQYLEDFCEKEGFTCRTRKTRKLPFIQKGPFSQKKLYKLLGRTKVGISVGGGGFDTARFWEILANNCLLVTEHIDIFRPQDNAFPYSRINQFKNLEEFKEQISLVGEFLKTRYNQKDMHGEYEQILKDHSSKARTMKVIEEAKQNY